MHRKFRIPNGRRDAYLFGVIGNFVGIERKNPEAFIEAETTKPIMGTDRIALAERKASKRPHGVVSNEGRVAVEHDLGDFRYLKCPRLVGQVEFELTECHHRRSMKSPRD